MAILPRTHAEVDEEATRPYHDQNGHEHPPSFEIRDSPVENFRLMKVIVIGAGFSGIYCGIRIPQRLRNVQLTIYEKNEGVGGTWWENRYPGCACDIPAHSYQYSFAPNPHWSKFYAPAGEIRAYLESVVDKFSVNRFIKCSHKVVACSWNGAKRKWNVSVENLQTGEKVADEADVVISARGALNEISWPKLDNLSDLAIPVMHSAAWDNNYDFEKKRIGIIGGGSSAIQIIPELQKKTGAHLTCFVRSKTWISRPFGDSAVGKLGLDSIEFSKEQKQRFLDDEDYYLHFRSTIEKESNSVHSLTLKGSQMQDFVRQNFADMMKERLSRKPEILKSLLPEFSVCCRRLTPGPGYLEALVEDNVDFTSTPIRSLTMMMEMEGDYIVKCIRKMQKENIHAMEVKSEMVKSFSEIVEAYFKRTVYLDRCNSWYRSGGGAGDRITGLWPGSSLHAMETFRSPRWEDYEYLYEGETPENPTVNRLAWLGNGWSNAQVNADDGDLAFYLQPEFMDVPTAPFPEDSRIYKLRPFSY